MNRIEFINQLEELLCDIPREDREDALDYYKDYLDDAGEEQEEQVLEELGSPKKVAKMIKDSLYQRNESEGEYTETGYRNNRYETKQELEKQMEHPSSNNAKEVNNGWKIACIVLLIILGWPLIVSAAGIVFSVIVFVASLIFSLLMVGLCIIVAGVVLFVMGLVTIITTPAIAVFLCGIGILLSIIGLLFTILWVKICQVVIPPMLRGFVALCRKPFNRKAVA